MKKLSFWLGSAVIAALAFAFTDEAMGQAKKPPAPAPAPKIKIKNVDANELFNWRRECYDKAVNFYDPKVPGGNADMLRLMTGYANRITEINNFASMPNQQVWFQYKGVVGVNLGAPLLSNVIVKAKNRGNDFTDVINFVKPANLPAVGEAVHISGLYVPQLGLNQFPQFLTGAAISPYQGTQISLNAVKRTK